MSNTDSIALAAHFSYWKQQLGDRLPVLQLPTDRPRPPRATAAATRQSLEFSKQLADELAALSRREGVSLFATLLAAFKTMLYRYSNQEDIVVGSRIENCVANDDAASHQSCSGLLPLCTQLQGSLRFRELLHRVREVVDATVEHAVPSDQLRDVLQCESNGSDSRLFQVTFEFHGARSPAPERQGASSASRNDERVAAKHDLSLELHENSGTLQGWLEYDTDLFDARTVERMAAHIETLLRGIVANPEQRLSDLPLLTEAEWQQILVEWNDTAVDFPSGACLHELFEARVRQNPDAVAVVFEQSQVTYAELNRRANQLAHHLRSLGVGSDVMVGICVERSIEMVVGMLGIVKAGGAYVPMDPAYPQQRLAFMLEDTQVPVLLTLHRLLDGLPEHKSRVICLDRDWDAIAREKSENPNSGVTPENLSYVIYTSGSTGRPKAVMLDHRGRVNNFCDFNRRFSVGVGDRLLALSSLSFDMSAYDIFGTLAAGATAVMPAPSTTPDPARWAQLMVQHEITVWHSVPALLEMLVDYVSDRAALHPRSLRLALLGGDWIPLTLPDRLKSLVNGVQVISMGGATEVSMDSTIYEIKATDSNWKSIPYGFPMANQLAYVLDSRLQPQPIGVPGELHLGGIGVGRGYLNRPELTAEKFIDNPFRPGERLYKTGDLARYRPDGNLELLGRVDFQVKIRGFRVELGEIEAALRQHAAVRECVVLARDDKHREKRLVAYVVQNAAYLGASEEVPQWQDAQISHWQMVYDTAYSRASDQADPTFNIVSWDSSYTGGPLLAEEMREWVDQTVDRIRALKPRRVLEIGCGTGLLLFRIAPDCEKYWGTDISQVALDYVTQELARQSLPQVSLFKQAGDDFTGIEPGSFDAVVLNSIIMDFPSVDYLMRVLRGAVKSLAPGGAVFVGDVRNLALLEPFATSVQLHKAAASLTKQQLQQRVRKQISMEEELVIDPAFFRMLPQHIPEIGHVQIHLKRGRHHNELTKFRYDLTLHVCPRDAVPQFKGQWLDWQKDKLSVESMRRLLRDNEPAQIGIKRVPNARTLADIRMVQRLADADEHQTAELLRESLNSIRQQVPGVDPESLWKMAEEFPYAISISDAETGERDCFDVIMIRRPADRAASGPILFPGSSVNGHRALHDYANNPLQAKTTRKLGPELRKYLENRLPSYMVPSAFVLLDAFPLSPNGKVNRRALPVLDTERPETGRAFVMPRSPIEIVVADVWADVLGLDEVGIHDGFLELGGSSLLATQAAAHLREIFPVNLPLDAIYRLTVAELAQQVEQRGQALRIDVSEIARALVQVHEMSDADVQSMLAEKSNAS